MNHLTMPCSFATHGIHLTNSTSPHLSPVCFYGIPDHAPLHSFPTRRSSDLAPPRTRAAAPSGRAGWRAPPRPPSAPAGGARSEDRKSTRLNSSHRTISYAVFCLKKHNDLITQPRQEEESRYESVFGADAATL